MPVKELPEGFFNDVGAPTAPPTSLEPGFFSDRADPVSKFIGSQNLDPNTAAKSLELSKETGVHPQVINADQQAFIQQRRATEAGELLRNNPALSGMVDGLALPEIVGDDLKNLDEVSKAAKAITTGDFGTDFSGRVLHYLTSPIWAAIGAGASGAEAGKKLYEETHAQDFLTRFTATPKFVGREALAGLGILGAPFAPVFEPIADVLRYAGLSDDQITLAMFGLRAPRAKVPLNAAEQAHIEAGDLPPPGTGPVSDALHIVQANTNAAKLDHLVETAQSAELRTRSPDSFADLVNNTSKNANVYIPAAKVLDLYANTQPGPKDGILGLRPEQLEEAARTGSDITMRVGDFVAKASPELYQGLRDDIRLQANGVSVNEAGKLKPPAETPPRMGSAPLPEAEAQAVRNQIKTSFYFQPLFQNAKAAGMTEAEFKAYGERFMQLENEDFQAFATKAAAIKQRELTPEWKAAEKRIRPEVENEFNGLDTISQSFNGTESNPARLKLMIDREVQSRLEAEFGGGVRQLALEHGYETALSDRVVDLLTQESQKLSERLGGRPISLNDVKADVAARFAEKPTNEASSAIFRRAVETAAKDAHKAVLAEKFDEALKSQQERLEASLMLREALAFEREKARSETVFDRGLKRDGKPDEQNYLNHIRKVLSDIGYTDRTFVQPTEALKALADTSDGQIAVADWLTNGSVPPKYEDMTVQQVRDLRKSIDSLAHVGRQEQILTTAYNRATIENAARDVATSVSRFPFIEQPLNKSLKKRAGSLYRQYVSAWNVLPERILDYSDAFNPKGPMSTYIDRPMREAYSKELRLQEAVKTKLRALDDLNIKLFDRIENDVIKDPLTQDKFLNMNRQNLRQLMLFMGSDSGLEKAAAGFKVDKADLVRLVERNATKEDVAWVNGIHTIYESMWPEIQALELRYTGVAPDKIEPLPRTITLANGEKAEMRGGYAPIEYDTARSKIDTHIAKNSELFEPSYRRAATTPHSFTKARTAYTDYLDLSGRNFASHIKQEIHDIAFREVVRDTWKLVNNPIFSDAMKQHWGVEINRIFPDWVKDLANVQRVDDSFAQGATYFFSALRENIVSALIFLNPGTFIKHGATAASMSLVAGGKAIIPETGRLLVDGAKGAMDNLLELAKLKEKAPRLSDEMMQALQDVTSNLDRGKLTRQFIYDSSPMMRNRQRNYRDTIEGLYDRTLSPEAFVKMRDIRGKSIDIGRSMVALFDSMSAMPLWLSEYKRAAAAGSDHPEAVYIADKAVTRAHGSSFIGDRAKVLRQGSEGWRWVTPLMQFWSHALNNVIQLGWDANAAKTRGLGAEPGANVPSMALRTIGLVLIPAVVEHLADMQWVGKDREDENVGKEIALASLRYFGSFFPGVREITNAIAGGREPSVGLWSTAGRSVWQFARDISKTMAGDDQSADWIVHYATMLGMGTGIGGAAPARTITGIRGRMSGEEEPESFAETIRQLKTGHPRPRGH